MKSPSFLHHFLSWICVFALEGHSLKYLERAYRVRGCFQEYSSNSFVPVNVMRPTIHSEILQSVRFRFSTYKLYEPQLQLRGGSFQSELFNPESEESSDIDELIDRQIETLPTYAWEKFWGKFQ